MPSTFTRSNSDLGNIYFNIHAERAGICPNGLPAGGPTSLCTLPGPPQANNFAHRRHELEPDRPTRACALRALYQINDDWNVLITQSFQNLDAEGISDGIPDRLGLPARSARCRSPPSRRPTTRTTAQNTAWTVNGKIGPLQGRLHRRLPGPRTSTSSRTTPTTRARVGGMYYECTGGGTGWSARRAADLLLAGRQLARHGQQHPPEQRIPAEHAGRLAHPRHRGRVLGGLPHLRRHELQLQDHPVLHAGRTSPSRQAGGPPCLANVGPAPGSTANDPSIRSDTTAFGEDTQRGYDQTAFFGSVDFDMIPHVLTITGGTRWYQYNEFEVGSQYATGSGLPERAERPVRRRRRQHRRGRTTTRPTPASRAAATSPGTSRRT